MNTPFVPFPFCIPPWGCLPNPSITIFYLLLLLFPGGSRGSPPGYFSLSLASIYKTSIEIFTHPFFPLPLSIPPWGGSPQSYSIFFFFTYYHYYSLVQGVWVQGVSPWLILSFSCFNLQNLNTDIKRHILSPPW